MKILQKKFTSSGGWKIFRDPELKPEDYSLVLVFSTTELLSQSSIYLGLRQDFPNAEIVLSSTAGEIIDVEVVDNSVSVTAIHFEKTRIQAASIDIQKVLDSNEAGKRLAESLQHKKLNNVFIISDGQLVNGSDLVTGLQQKLPENTIITGGLAGDGGKFMRTLVGLNEMPVEGKIVAIGFYGPLHVTYGSFGGWDSFGPERLITRSDKNILYELDGKPALDIYKMYLGEHVAELPKSGLLFPLSIRMSEGNEPLVRTILSISEKDRSLTFAGNMPEGNYARLMKANLDRLIEGASMAAQHSTNESLKHPDLAILISCVGRKFVLDQRVEEEIEVIRNIYGEKTALTGFYSHGEISPSFHFLNCELHNQTMTITTLTEN